MKNKLKKIKKSEEKTGENNKEKIIRITQTQNSKVKTKKKK